MTRTINDTMVKNGQSRNTRNIGHRTKTKITRYSNKIQNAKKMSTADPSTKNGVNSCARDDRKVRDHIYV